MLVADRAGHGASGQAVVDVHPVGLDAEPGEPVALSGEVLVVGRAARVPNQHPGHAHTVPFKLRSPGNKADGCYGNFWLARIRQISRGHLASWSVPVDGRLADRFSPACRSGVGLPRDQFRERPGQGSGEPVTEGGDRVIIGWRAGFERQRQPSLGLVGIPRDEV